MNIQFTQFGKVLISIPKTNAPTKYTVKNIKITPRKFKKIPALIIFVIGTRPEPKTIAFGGVATGNMKAHDADSVAGIINNSGWMWIATATEAKMGSIISVVAVFEVISVKNVTPRLMMTITSAGAVLL